MPFNFPSFGRRTSSNNTFSTPATSEPRDAHTANASAARPPPEAKGHAPLGRALLLDRGRRV